MQCCLFVLLDFSLEGELIGNCIHVLEHGGNLDESRRVVEAKHEIEASGQLERSAPHSTPYIQGFQSYLSV